MTLFRFLLVLAIIAFSKAPVPVSAATLVAPHPGVPSIAAGADSSAPFFSGDGRFLFFQSLANDLVPVDSSALTLDLFRYEPASGALMRVSAEPVAKGTPGDWISPVTSADGDVVVFASLSTAIVAGKTNARVMDIFWKRISSGEIGLVSVSSNGISGGNADSREPVISADGRYVAFESDATDLASFTNAWRQAGVASSMIYLRDLQRSQVVVVSVPDATNILSASAHSPSVSNNGNLIAFYTKSFLSGSRLTRLVVRDNLTEEVVWTYTMAEFTGSNCRGPEFSPDGRRVAFFSRETSARMRLAVHDLQTGDDYSLTNDFFLCAPIVWSAGGTRIYLEGIFQIGSWDFQTGEVRWQNLRSPSSVQSSASWSGLAVSTDSSFLIYRDNFIEAGGDAKRPTPGLFFRRWPDGETNLITLDPTGAPALQEEIGTPVLSADGRWMAFEASDSTLVHGDINRSKDVFLHDRQTGTTQLISSHRLDRPAATGSGSLAGKVSLAGANRLLAFSSGDGNHAVGDTNRSLDVFIQDVGTGDTRSATLHQPGFARPYQRYLSPQLSLSGSVVAFLGYGVNSTDTSVLPLAPELHVLNLETGDRQTLMPPGNALWPNGYPAPPRFCLSTNGQRIAFETDITGLGAPTQILMRDISAGSNILVSATPSRKPGNGSSAQPWLTADGRRVIFVSSSTDLLTQPVGPALRRLYERDLESGTTRLLSTNLVLYPVDAPVISPDGRYAAFRMGEAPKNSVDELARVIDLSSAPVTRMYAGVRQLYGFDRQSRYAVGLMTNASQFSAEGTLCRLDLTSGDTVPFSAGRGLGFWLGVAPDFPPVISADGRYIVFESPDDALVAGDNNRAGDVFVRDTWKGTTLLVSASRTGKGSGNGLSSQPVLSADGGAVVFRSRASDLVDGDYNTKGDIFILTFDLPDTDADGLPDDWEMTYFGSLSRDGKGDLDLDGQTDAAEYHAGTDPTGANSVLRVLRLQSSLENGTEIMWAAVVGKHYRVEFKNSVTQVEWTPGVGDYLAASTTGRWTDLAIPPAGQRFYRVVVLE